MDCPDCIGKMQRTEADGWPVYQCPICGHQESDARARDKSRWWGPVHLPFIDVVAHPAAAFHQLSENPAIVANLLWSLCSSALYWHVSLNAHDGAMRQLLHMFPWITHTLAGSLAAWIMGLGIATVMSLAIHGAAKLVCEYNSRASRATFIEMWSIAVFLHSAVTLISTLAFFVHKPLVLSATISIGDIVLTIWAIRVVYGFRLARSIGVWFSALVASTVVWIVAVAGIMVSAVLGPTRHVLEGHADAMTRINRPADFQWTVKTLDGKVVPFSAFKGQVVFLNFWATWCGPCRREMPSIQKLYEAFKTTPNVTFLCVSTENADVVKQFLKKTSYTFPVYVTEGIEAPQTFSHNAIPTTFLVSRAGRVVIQRTGSTDWSSDTIHALILSLLQSTTTPVLVSPPIDVPPATPDDRDIAIQPMADLNGVSRSALLARRTADVFQDPDLAPAHY